MPATLVNPLDERLPPRAAPAPRLGSLAGARIALLDISKPGGAIFLDRLAALFKERYGVTDVLRFRKPTFGRLAPQEVLADIREAQPQAVIEALAD